MDTNLNSQVHFFNTLRDIIGAKPYAVLCSEEVTSLINQIDTLTHSAKSQSAGFEHAHALRQAVHNAKSDGYFPIVVLPARKYEAARSFLGGA